jgi:hypothetical protein
MEKRMKRLNRNLLGGLLVSLALPLAAHHSGAMYDSTRTESITGTVVEFNWVNPHSSILLEVPDKDGKPAIWAVEMNTPQNLAAAGWKRKTIQPGDKVTLVVRPLRNGKPGGSYVSITLADGTKLN